MNAEDEPDEPVSSSAEVEQRVLGSIQGQIPRVHVPRFYSLGLVFIALAMVLLPLSSVLG